MGLEGDAFDPALAAALADPVPDAARDVAESVDVGEGFGRGGGGGLLRGDGVGEADDLQLGRVLQPGGGLIHGDQDVGGGAEDADEHGFVAAADPAIGAEAGEHDLARGGAGCGGEARAGEAGGRVGGRGAGGVGDAVEARVEQHEIGGGFDLGAAD